MRVMCGIVLVRLGAASVLLSHSPGKNLTRFLAAGSLPGGFFIERWFVDPTIGDTNRIPRGWITVTAPLRMQLKI